MYHVVIVLLKYSLTLNNDMAPEIILAIILVICLMLSVTCYAVHYVSIKQLPLSLSKLILDLNYFGRLLPSGSDNWYCRIKFLETIVNVLL